MPSCRPGPGCEFPYHCSQEQGSAKQAIRWSFSTLRSLFLRRLTSAIFAVCFCLLACLDARANANNRLMMTGDDPYNLRVLAFQCYIEGQTESALETYQRAVKRAIEEYGNDSTIVADIYFEMGSLAFDAGKENTAENWLNESLKRNPNSEMCRIKLAEIYRVRSKHDQALTQIQTCLKRNRNSVPARRALVMWLQEKGFVALATQESYVLNQIASGADKRIAPPSSMQVATAVRSTPPPAVKKEESPPVKPEPKQEAKQPEKPKAPPSIVATLMKRAITPAKKKEPVKPVAEKPAPPKPAVVKQPVVVQKPKKEPEPKKEEPKKEEPKQETAKAPAPKKIERPQPPPPPIVAAKEPKRSRNGLVPPPPPIMPPFPGMFPPPPPMSYNANAPLLQTHASIKKEKPKAEARKTEEPKEKESKDTASVDEDGEGDFLIDWAGSTKKKKK